MFSGRKKCFCASSMVSRRSSIPRQLARVAVEAPSAVAILRQVSQRWPVPLVAVRLECSCSDGSLSPAIFLAQTYAEVASATVAHELRDTAAPGCCDARRCRDDQLSPSPGGDGWQ